MAKITTIIDIGSNSMRMVVFKKTSRFAFHLINESKSKVKISEGCYENNGNLQFLPMQRAYDALKSFLEIAKNLKSRKILCVATSALRDAPNNSEFISKVSKELKLNIKIIDGKKEAYYGGIAALNLIDCKDFTTVDIGGGSTEFAFIKDGNLIDTISLDIGTVRIQELYLNKNDIIGAKNYIISHLESVDTTLTTLVGLGGSIRALSRIIIKQDNYPLDSLHGFEYQAQERLPLFKSIIEAKSTKELKLLGVEKDRYDTIVTGTLIFKIILKHFEVKKVITSGVGVREGVYLTDLLRTSNYKFPVNFNVSIRSLLDRFVNDESMSGYLGNNARNIFEVLKPLHNLDEKYRTILIIASKLQQIGISLNFNYNEDNAFRYILNGLNYGFTHQDKILIATIAKLTKKSLRKQKDIEIFESLLPNLEIVRWLNFMMTLNLSLNCEYTKTKYDYLLEENKLIIKSNNTQYLVKNALQTIKTPINLIMEYN
ncbi:Ppx/GppA family phosphatase [Arcobacteraceae bacterium]|nr:Ppx/GppA family phosphatase [Arcobacteraceae bacterium]